LLFGQQSFVVRASAIALPALAQRPSPKLAVASAGVAPVVEFQGGVSSFETLLYGNQSMDSAVVRKHSLVLQDQIPVSSLHTIAVGSTTAVGSQSSLPARASGVRRRLMANTLAAQATASPHDAASLTGAERL